ncbi:MAG: DUF4364 family protein [Clostridia bacterium]|nr:DUF4364 family protein [Clostridia bacterium]
MNRDTFSAGVEPGGLHSHNEIKILICYMLNGVHEPLSRTVVLDILSGDGMANFFDASAAIDDLVKRGNLTEDDNGLLTVTEAGRHAAATLADMIPFTLRERSVTAGLRLLARQHSERDNRAEIAPCENGGWVVSCSVGKDAPLFRFELLVGDELQAQQVRDRFLDDPLLLYQSVIGIVSGGAKLNSAANQITIELP